MFTKKILSLALIYLGVLSGPLSAIESPRLVAVVNFTTCISDSKLGKQERENLQYMQKQMTSMMEDTEKELKELHVKFDDMEYMESLSPKAEEELRIKYESLKQDFDRYQNQFYQTLNEANYRIMQNLNNNISLAAEKVASEKKLAFVINKEACFYSNPDLEITSLVINEMDKSFDREQKQKKLSENSEMKSSN